MNKFLNNRKLNLIVLFVLISTLIYKSVFADQGEETHGQFVNTLLIIGILLFTGRLLGSIAEKFNQSAVIGEIIAGIILVNLGFFGIHTFENVKNDAAISFLSQLGIIILLLLVGLESDIKEMTKIGWKALFVAMTGAFIPFVTGVFILGPLILPNGNVNQYVFLGATLTATSIGITARVFKDTKTIKNIEARIVLGAAIIDDIFGLIILAVASAMITVGDVNVFDIIIIFLKAFGFLVISIMLGQYLAPYLGGIFSKLHKGAGMKFTLVISFAFLYAYIAGMIGLAPIIGAFAAGLVFDPVHFKNFRRSKIIEKLLSPKRSSGLSEDTIKVANKYADQHVEDLIETLGYFVVPVFFVITGMNVHLSVFADIEIIGIALILSATAFLTKLLSGFAAGKGINKAIVGVGMAPRGEVCLIFATIGKDLNVFDDKIFAMVIIMVILTTLVTPPLLNWLIKRKR